MESKTYDFTPIARLLSIFFMIIIFMTLFAMWCGMPFIGAISVSIFIAILILAIYTNGDLNHGGL